MCPSYAPDLAEALVAVIERAPPGTYHAANSGECTWFEFARAILDEAGLSDVPIAEITAGELGRPARRPASSRFSCEKLAEATGVRLRHWREAMREHLAHELEESES